MSRRRTKICPKRKSTSRRSSTRKRESTPRKLLEYEKPEQRGRVYNSLKNAASQFKTSVIGLCVLEGVSLLLLLIPKILEWAAIDAPAFDRGGAGLAAANIVLLLASFYLAFPNILSGVKALANGRVTGGAVGGLTFILALVQTIPRSSTNHPRVLRACSTARRRYSLCS